MFRAAIAVVCGCLAPTLWAQTFTQNTPVTFAGGGGGVANPYPSMLAVNGVGAVQYMTVNLNLMSASNTGDTVGLLLVSPGGRKVELGVAQLGGAGTPTAWAVILADDGATELPSLIDSGGVYRPKLNGAATYPAPAPAAPYAGSLSNFYSGTINGNWNLYVLGAGSSRTVLSGWSLTFNGVRQAQPVGTAFSYQGKLNKSGVPVQGLADLRFTLWNHSTSTNVGNRVGAVLTKTNVPVVGGVFSTTLDFGDWVEGESGLWMDVEAASPPGSGYVAMTPRQQVMALPRATRAGVATMAEGISLTEAGRLNGQDLYFRSWPDVNHLMGWYGSTRTFAGISVDGPVLAGYAGGGLGSKDGSLERLTLRWTNTGRVGIQTPVPLARLHVQGDSTNDLGVLISSSGAGWGSGVRFENLSGRTYGMYSSGDGMWQFTDQTAGATRMVINSAGNVGIGTTTLPQKLNVNGIIRSTGNDFLLAGRGGGQGNNGANARALVDAGWPGGALGSVDGGGLFINYANDYGRVVIGSGLLVQGNINATGTITPSSGRLKLGAAPMSDALEKLLKLDAVRFDWTADEAARRGGRVHDLGFIAEDVEKLFPEVVYRDAEGTVIGMDYARLSAVAVQAIKQQQEEIRSQREELESLRARMEKLEKAIAR